MRNWLKSVNTICQSPVRWVGEVEWEDGKKETLTWTNGNMWAALMLNRHLEEVEEILLGADKIPWKFSNSKPFIFKPFIFKRQEVAEK